MSVSDREDGPERSDRDLPPFWRRGPMGSAIVRLIAAHLAVILLGAALVFGGMFVATQSELRERLRDTVRVETHGLEKDYHDLGAFGLSRRIQGRVSIDRGGQSVYLLQSPTGVRLAGNVVKWPGGVEPDRRFASLVLRLTDGRRDVPAEVWAVRLSGGERLLIGRVSEAVEVFNAALLRWTFLSALLIAALPVFAGANVARLLRRRLAAVSETADEIMAGDLGQRVGVSGAGDEFDQLARRLNAMLDRISDLVADLRMVTDSVAHDLRSPLTRLRGHLELALQSEALRGGAAGEAARESIAKALAEADGALEAFASLIAIARAEAGVGREQFEEIEISELIFQLADLYQPAAEEVGVRISSAATQGLRARGHRQLLAQAVSNLIENALKHAPRGTEVRVRAAAEANAATISIADQGPGIPVDDRERALRRFERLDSGRGGTGFGLGLALAAAVARLHGGALRLEDAEPGRAAPGLEATIVLPPV